MGLKADPALKLRMEYELGEARKHLRHAAHKYHTASEASKKAAEKELYNSARNFVAAELIYGGLEK